MIWFYGLLAWSVIGCAVWVKIQPNWEGQVAPQFVIWCWPVILVMGWINRPDA